MSSIKVKDLSISDLKMKLSQMGMSLDKAEHNRNYYEKMYLNTSNAKNKVTRNNTPFYQEKNISRKRERERTSDKKKKIDNKKKNFEDSLLDEEESNKEGKIIITERKRKKNKSQNKNTINNESVKLDSSSGIKTTRLIMSKYKKPDMIYKNNLSSNIKESGIKLRSPRTRRNAVNNSNNIEDDFIYYDEGYKSKAKSKNKKKPEKANPKNENIEIKKNIITPKEENIINIPAQNDNIYNYKNNNETTMNDFIDTSNQNSLIKDYYLTSEEKDKQNNITFQDNNNQELSQINQNLNNIKNTSDLEKNQNKIELTPSEYSASTSRFSRFSGFSYFSKIGTNFQNMKNCVMNKFRKNAYLFPLIILILFGLVFFFNERYENFERRNIIIIFSIIMGLIILFNLCKYLKDLKKYKKIAREDKKKLMELLGKENLTKDDIGNKFVLLNEFIQNRINENGITEAEYMKYVFPYLVKYLKKDGFILKMQSDEEKGFGENGINFFKKF